jgi:DNA-binding transcriptional ArsR family regulator
MNTRRPDPTHHEFEAVFRALSDTTRRDVLCAVTKQRSVMEVVERMRLTSSRTAVSRHLAILREVGLVLEEPGYDLRNQVRMQIASRRRIEEAFASLLRMWDR